MRNSVDYGSLVFLKKYKQVYPGELWEKLVTVVASGQGNWIRGHNYVSWQLIFFFLLFHRLFQSMLFHFHDLVNTFPVFSILLISEYTLDCIYLLKIYWHNLWHNVWYTLENVSCAFEKNVYAVTGSSVLRVYLRSRSSVTLLESCFLN